jgi:DNA polymerase-3 subunit delta'
MSELPADPRESPLHPRYEKALLGHGAVMAQFAATLSSGRPHHAWLITGPRGIGKSTFAYQAARHVLASGASQEKSDRLVFNRAHPDLAVLQCAMADSKAARLKSEISVEDARAFMELFSQTASGGGWRVGLVDCADDLTREAANALLKLVEEPPANSLLFIINHQPGKLLRTLRSRCRRLPLSPLPSAAVLDVLEALSWEERPSREALQQAASLSGGSPGRAIELVSSEGARAFAEVLKRPGLDAASRQDISNFFVNHATLSSDYRIFMELFLDWLARSAIEEPQSKDAVARAQVYGRLQNRTIEVESYNLDRRVAVMEALSSLQQALKVA